MSGRVQSHKTMVSGRKILRKLMHPDVRRQDVLCSILSHWYESKPGQGLSVILELRGSVGLAEKQSEEAETTIPDGWLG